LARRLPTQDSVTARVSSGPSRPRRLLSIGHSYVVALNRKLPQEIARESGGAWEVTAVAPSFVQSGLGPTGIEIQNGEQLSLKILPTHLTGFPQLLFYGGALRELLRERWDFVHCWEEPYVLVGGQVAWSIRRDTPWAFYTFQNLDKRYPPPFRNIERYCIDRCAGWIASGESVARVQLARGYERKPHRVIPLGVDLATFSPNAAAGLSVRRELGWDQPGPPIVGFLGRLIEEKGIRLLTSILSKTSSPWRAMFVGMGPLEAEIRRWSADFGDRVRVVTGVEHQRVPDHLNAMDILCAPSQTTTRWREQFGRMLVEAFACGVPVLTSNSGEIPYVVGDAGVIVDERDEVQWIAALAALLESPSQRKELAGRGLDRARTRFDWRVVARQHLGFFDELIDRRGAAAQPSPA
jgi:glycosyltransferase involved in cell wall biosynthesis